MRVPDRRLFIASAHDRQIRAKIPITILDRLTDVYQPCGGNLHKGVFLSDFPGLFHVRNSNGFSGIVTKEQIDATVKAIGVALRNLRSAK
ncbi:MAG: hypothetical protein AB9917_15825 [Negativicutes bacterium]